MDDPNRLRAKKIVDAYLAHPEMAPYFAGGQHKRGEAEVMLEGVIAGELAAAERRGRERVPRRRR